MNFQLLNDMVCGEPRLIAIVDDMDPSLEHTTRAVFPAARICMDTANGRNRMIVLLDHATTEMTVIAKSFFMKPDNKVSVQIVAVPHTDPLRAEKQVKSETQIKKEEKKEVATAPVTGKEAAPASLTEEKEDAAEEPAKMNPSAEEQKAEEPVPQNTENASPMETEDANKQPEIKKEAVEVSQKEQAEEAKASEAAQTQAKDSALSEKETDTLKALWGNDAAFEETFKEANERFHEVRNTMHAEDSKEAFLVLLEKDEAKCGRKTLQLQLKWLDAIGSYCKAAGSKGAREAAETLLAKCLSNKQLYANGRACLQLIPGLSNPSLRRIRAQQKAESFAAYFDALSKEEQGELTRQIFQDISFEKIGQ